MPDIEKVIEGLRRCSCNVPDACSDCPYDPFPSRICVIHLTKDALELLTKEEAIEPQQRTEVDEWTCCGNCGRHIISKWSVCPYCGRRIKWDADD